MSEIIDVKFYLKDERGRNKTMFIEDAMEAGFTKEMAEFLEEHLAKDPHTHTIDDVEGLEEALEDEGEEEEEE